MSGTTTTTTTMTTPTAEEPPAVPPLPVEEPTEQQPARPPRRVLRAVGRWTAAVAVFAVLGGGIGYGLTTPERTELPGLSTKSDGRWDYPKLSLPPLPAGSPAPFTDGNPAQIHHVDIRDLLLPAPKEAATDDDLPPLDGGWVSGAAFASLYEKDGRGQIEQTLADDAVRHIAARGWVMPDGTRTSVYLLQFDSQAYAMDFSGVLTAGGLSPATALTGAPEAELDDGWPTEATLENVLRDAYDEAKPYGKTHVRQAYLTAGDTVGLVVQETSGSAPRVPWEQTVILQSQLLG
jgi:hypothetical protein